MELIDLTLSRFKRFENRRIEFRQGFNLIWGPNESGKSTVYDAICCALFGRDRGKIVDNWNGGPCAVTLEYMHDGRIYRLERQFTEGLSKLGTVIDGQLADVIIGKDEIAAKITEHLGIGSRTVLDNTIFVRQADVSRPGTSEMSAVGDEIQRILTGTAHTSATEAVRKMESSRDSVKGKSRPTNPREYDRISQRLSSLAEDLAKAKGSRDCIARMGDELTELDTRVERDSSRQEALRRLLDRHRRWAELKERARELDQRHRDAYTTVKSLSGAVEELQSVQSELQGYASLVGKDSEIAEQLTVTGSKKGELEVRIAEIEGSGETPGSPAGGLAAILLVTGAIVTGMAGLFGGFGIDIRFFLLCIPAAIMAVAFIQIRATGKASISKHLADMQAFAQNELNQVHSEEQSILNYLGCQDTDRAWNKICTYRSLAARANDLDITYRTLLAGKTLLDWNTVEADLARELNAVRREIEDDFAGYAPSAEESEKWRSEHATLQNSLPSAIARKHEVSGALEAESRNIRDIASLEGEIEYLHGRRNELEFLHRAYEEAIAALNSVTKAVSDEYLPVLSEKASELMDGATSGRYKSVRIKSGWEINVDCNERSSVSPGALSMGTMDQLYFSLRLACGNLLSEGRTLPLILDDPFASFDTERLHNVLEMLTSLAKANQVILLTHDPQILQWAQSDSGSRAVTLL